MTNEKLVLDIMNFSKYGALSQAMVMQALHHFTDLVIQQEEQLMAEHNQNIANKKISFVHTPSWIGVAKEIKQKLIENH